MASKSVSKRTIRWKTKDGQERTAQRWQARYRDEAGKEHAKLFRRQVDAKQWLDEVTAAVVTGVYVDPRRGKVTFRAWFEEWAAAQDWAQGTSAGAVTALKCVTFADVQIAAVTESHVRAWLKSMRATGLAASTRKARFTLVRMCFAAAVRMKVISADPTSEVSPPKVPKAETKMKVPTVEQVGDAIRAAPDEFRCFVAVCAFAGLRLGEAAGLQVGDVDFLRRTLTVERQVQGETAGQTAAVPPKYESGRTIHIPDELVKMVAKHIEQVGTHGAEGWLFSWCGNLLNRNSASKQWRLVRVKVGMDEFTLHDLRHFFASGLIADGCDVVTVQHALGHSSASVTLGTYSHLWPKADERVRTAATGLMSAALADSVRTVNANLQVRGLY